MKHSISSSRFHPPLGILIIALLLLLATANRLQGQGSVSGYAWIDADRNGIREGSERGFSGLLTKLHRQTAPGEFSELSSLRSESSGHFLFILSGDLLPAQLYLEFESAPGFFFTLPDRGADEQRDSDVDQSTGRTPGFTLENGDNASYWGAGYSEEAVTPPPPPPVPQADLSLIEFADKTESHIGDTLRYTLMVQNHGPDSALSVEIRMPRSAAVRFLAAVPAPADSAENPLRWTLPFLAADSSLRIEITALVVDNASMEDPACVTSATLDPDESDNCQYFIVDIEVPVELASFSAAMAAQGVHLQWVTQSESENMGFHLFRAETASGPFAQVSERMIRGNGTTAVRHHYEFFDTSVEQNRLYYYQLRDYDYAGRTVSHGPIEVSTALPQRFSLLQNHPNPFNASTRISFQLSESGPVTLTIYNAAGQRVRTLLESTLNAGAHQLLWDGCDHHGQPVASGLYFYGLNVAGQQLLRRMQMIK